MKKILAATLLAASVSAPALAADMPVKAPVPVVNPAYNWTGFHIGLNGGYGWQNDAQAVDLYTFANGPGVALATPGFDNKGWFYGAQAGYDYQIGSVVLGIEADLQGTNNTETNFGPLNGGAGPFFVNGTQFFGESKLDWFGTVRGRVGFAWNNVLIYGTGGYAFGHVTERVYGLNLAGGLFYNVNSVGNRDGWVAGGGFEYGFAPNWSVKGEYQYLDLGTDRLFGTNVAPVQGYTNEVKHEYHTARIGVNYRFNPWPAAAAVVAKY